MPTLARWFIKTALIYFIAALAAGALLAARAVVEAPPIVGALGPVYFHLFMVGWVTQLIMGMVYWMFPKYSQTQPRGDERVSWAVYILLNAGLALRVLSEPALSLTQAPPAGWALALSAVLQWLAGIGFVVNAWARVKER